MRIVQTIKNRMGFNKAIQTVRRCFFNTCIKLNGNRLFRLITGGILFSIFVTNIAHAATIDPSKDVLAADKSDITNNFGAGSTFMYIIYLIEIIVAAVTYNKTRNMLALTGIIVLMIFINVAFKTIGS
jgi:type IV conjugative transfer system pilin TraA